MHKLNTHAAGEEKGIWMRPGAWGWHGAVSSIEAFSFL
jgi:hypothetical protein